MGERTQYAPGTFSWTDLSTTDPDAAKAFYSGLFGWEAEDLPAGEGMVYSMMRLGGRDVAAISGQMESMRGAPPVWSSYVTVTDADQVASRAGELGATVVAPPFDVFTAGRMAVIQDPQGALFMIWQPGDRIGAGLVNEPGALVWNELASPDLEASAGFYRELFGWTVGAFPGAPEGPPYLAISVGDARNGGIRPAQEGEPPAWIVYFGTDDLDRSLAKAGELGGTKLVGPMDIQIARFAVIQDPQGAVFCLYDGQLDP